MILSLEHNLLSSDEMNYLLEWSEVMLSSEDIFADINGMSDYLKKWICDYQTKQKIVNNISIAIYADTVILISNPDSGEFIKLKDVSRAMAKRK